MLPFSSLEERGNLLPFEMKEGLLKNVMELRRCSFEDAMEWLDEQEDKRLPIPQVYALLQGLCSPRILVDKTPHKCVQPHIHNAVSSSPSLSRPA